MNRSPLLTVTPSGLYCPAADVYIDARRPVPRCFITHAHADHARVGHGEYVAHEVTAPILRHRLGSDIQLHALSYGEPMRVNGVDFSLHPAGHIPGSAQVRVERSGEVWVVSGDYKTEYDGISTPFEPVRCHTFISEATFALPIYHWRPQSEIAGEIKDWWARNAREGRASVLFCYSLGKAQRLLRMLEGNSPGPIFAHGAIYFTTNVVREAGVAVPELQLCTPEIGRSHTRTALILAPPSTAESSWLARFAPFSGGSASGWMAVRNIRRRRGMDCGFVLSDHADWEGLHTAITETGAERIFMTHGYTAVMSRWLSEKGLDAAPLGPHDARAEGNEGGQPAEEAE